MKRMSMAGLGLLVAAVAGLALRHALVASGVLGLTVQAAAVALNLWARFAFGGRSFHATADPTEGGLVTTGPYGWIRHPIYASILLFFLGGVATHLSLLNLGLGGVAVAGAVLRIVPEERLVLERYPEYAGYAARTKRLIPFLL